MAKSKMTQNLITTSVSSLLGGNLTIPAFQRDIAWKKSDMQLLITSVLMDWKIPQIYLAKRGKVKHDVIDGQQRITSLKEFAADEFPVGQEPYFEGGELKFRDIVMDLDLEDGPVNVTGMLYSELPKEAKQIFDTYNMSIVEMVDCTAKEARKWFLLINQQSKKLNATEMRGALGGNIPLIVKNLAGSRTKKPHPFFNFCNYANTRMAYAATAYQLIILAHTQGPCQLNKAELDLFTIEQENLAKDSVTVQEVNAVMDFMCEVFEHVGDEDGDNTYTKTDGTVKDLKKTTVPAIFAAIHGFVLESRELSAEKVAEWWMDFNDRIKDESADTQAYREATARQTDQEWSVRSRIEFITTELEQVAGPVKKTVKPAPVVAAEVELESE